MANTNAAQYPYMSAFRTNSAASELSTLGEVLVNMSSFDVEKYYTSGETVQAKDYVDATTDDQIVRLRPNTEEGSVIPLQVQLTAADTDKGKYSAATYQIDVPVGGTYTFTLHAKGADATLSIAPDGAEAATELNLAGHPDDWADYKADVTLAAGRNTVKITNLSANPVLLNSWKFDAATGIDGVAPTGSSDGIRTVYNLQGIRLGTVRSESDLGLDKGIYILVSPDGTSRKVII